jgi:hypothetical protein
MAHKRNAAGHRRDKPLNRSKRKTAGTQGRSNSKSLWRYPLSDEFTLELSGDWTRGGFLEFLIRGELVDRIEFGAAPWSLAANLFLAAIHADHWTDAFVPTDSLVQRLGELSVILTPTKQKVYKLIDEIRDKLADTTVRLLTADAQLSGDDWAERLLETRRSLGYRFAISPKNLKLTFGEPKFDARPMRTGPGDKGEEHSRSAGLLPHGRPRDDARRAETRRKPR